MKPDPVTSDPVKPDAARSVQDAPVQGKSIQVTPLAWAALGLLGVIWGASFMGAKLALTGFGPVSVAALRLLIGALVLTLNSYRQGYGLPAFGSRTDKRIWLHIAGMGIFSNAASFVLLNWGQQYVTSGFAGITMAVVPLFVLPLAHFLVPGEGMSLRKVSGFLTGFAGVVILIGPAALSGNTGADMEPFAGPACVAAACCYATGGVITRLCPPVHTVSFGAAALLFATVLMVPFALVYEGIPSTPDAVSLAGVVYLGLFPTALATLLLVWVINNAGPGFLSQVNYQVPVWALVFGAVLMSEPVPGRLIWALCLILSGLLITRIRLKARN